MTCIVCPMGCRISVEDEGACITGHGCRRGEEYARMEIIDPRRILTAVVTVEGRDGMLPVKTAQPIPKASLFTAMAEIRQLRVIPPIRFGQVVVVNLVGTGVALVATKEIQ